MYLSAFSSCYGIGALKWALSYGMQLDKGLSSKVRMVCFSYNLQMVLMSPCSARFWLGLYFWCFAHGRNTFHPFIVKLKRMLITNHIAKQIRHCKYCNKLQILELGNIAQLTSIYKKIENSKFCYVVIYTFF